MDVKIGILAKVVVSIIHTVPSARFGVPGRVLDAFLVEYHAWSVITRPRIGELDAVEFLQVVQGFDNAVCRLTSSRR